MAVLPLQSLWSVTAPAPPPLGPLRGARRAHAVIVGAGYTGLSAALHLANAGREVVVVEACGLGERASGLNGGQVIPGVKHDPDTLEQLFGAVQGTRLVATVAAAADAVFELIERHAIACDATRSGWIQPATSEAALAALATRAAQWQRRGAAVEVLSRERVKELTGSALYCGGLLDRRGGTVQPLSYLRGLARAALGAGAALHVRSPALRLLRVANEWRVDTPEGSVTAPAVIVATNAYSDRLGGTLRRTYVRVPSFQVATRPLAPQLLQQILPQRQAASDTWQLLRYFRTDASGRFVLGTRGSFAASPDLGAVQHHYRAVREIYPQLEGVAFEYHWGGWVAMTADHLPHLHELGDGVYAGLGYNGRGVSMATVMGRLLGQCVLGVPAEELAFPLSPVRPIALHALSGLGARAMVQYLRLVDGWRRSRGSAPEAR
jgi:glycine/D-amino acid oxidase-like deaminating enzyme